MTGYLAAYNAADMKNLVVARNYLSLVETAKIRGLLDAKRSFLHVCFLKGILVAFSHDKVGYR
jgi:hypothetical protein